MLARVARGVLIEDELIMWNVLMEVVGSNIVTFHYEDMKGLKEDETGIWILVKILTFI